MNTHGESVLRTSLGVLLLTLGMLSCARALADEQDIATLERLLAERLISEEVFARRLSRLKAPGSTTTPVRDEVRSTRPIARGGQVPGNEARRVALVIGNDDYRHLEPLETARNDARAIADRLHERFGFEVRLLENATRADVLGALARLRGTQDGNDTVILYYAGHGHLDSSSGRGYWWPVDAEPDLPTHWISNTDVADALRALDSRHVLVLSDACFSGSLAGADVPSPVALADADGAATTHRSRTLIASGSLEPVLDSADGVHSVFANALLGEIDRMRGAMSVRQLFEAVREQVSRHADQTPRYAVLPESGHVGGELVLTPLSR